MKSVLHAFVTKKARENMVSVGNKRAPEATYTKADFLTPGKVAEKFNISSEKARKLMKDLIFKRAYFALNGHKAPIATRFGKGGSNLYLHPMALEAFKQYLEQQKD